MTRPEINPSGLCQCGCGKKTPLAKETQLSRGWIKGKPIKYIHKHVPCGEKNPNWHGGKNIFRGYSATKMPDHPRAFKNGYILDHILVAEKILGEPLPPGAVVHHIDENKLNNNPSNLVICQDENYHRLVHKRLRRYKECGHVDWPRCGYCGKLDDPLNLYVSKSSSFHRKCRNKYLKNKYWKNKIDHTKCAPVRFEGGK